MDTPRMSYYIEPKITGEPTIVAGASPDAIAIVTMQDLTAWLAQEVTCPRCEGEGWIGDRNGDPCVWCEDELHRHMGRLTLGALIQKLEAK